MILFRYDSVLLLLSDLRAVARLGHDRVTTYGTTWTRMKPLQTLLWHDVTTCTPGRPPPFGKG